MLSKWQPIETAPKDGTVVRVANDQTDKSGMVLDAKWGKYRPIRGPEIDAWVIVRHHDPFMPVAPGTWVIPARWMAIPVEVEMIKAPLPVGIEDTPRIRARIAQAIKDADPHD